jgi:hypothetical protein
MNKKKRYKAGLSFGIAITLFIVLYNLLTTETLTSNVIFKSVILAVLFGWLIVRFAIQIFVEQVKKIQLGTIEVLLTQVQNNVRLDSKVKNGLLNRQDIETIGPILISNYKTVRLYFEKNLIAEGPDIISEDDLDIVSLKVAFIYLFIYNQWRNRYKNRKNIALYFRDEDFNEFHTFNEIVTYFKDKYKDWAKRTMLVLNLNEEQFKSKYELRKLISNE